MLCAVATRSAPTITPAPGATRLRIAVAVVVVALAGIVAWAVTEAGDDRLSPPEAIVLGVVEGITEYLPVSSTGHLLVTQDLLGLTDTPEGKEAADSYAIAIQFGAIVAVAGLYRRRILATLTGLTRPAHTDAGATARSLATALVIAFIPAAVVGVLTDDWIKDNLFSTWTVVAAWAVGGVGILVFASRNLPGERQLELVTARDGLIIGVAQILALWPGMSRSLVTIIAAVLVGLRVSAAVEFSFLLGLATLTAATVYESLGNGGTIIEQYGWGPTLLGFGAALVSAAAAVMWLVTYLQRHSLAIFGWYRLSIAAITTVLLFTVLDA